MIGAAGGPSAADLALTAAGSGAVGAIVSAVAVVLQQRSSTRSRSDSAVLSGSAAASAMATAAIGQWQQIVAAQGKIQAEHVAEINRLRERAETCEAASAAQELELNRLRNELRRLEARVIEERRDRPQ